MNPKEVLKESISTYLHQKLSKVEADIFTIAKKYGVKDVFELDAKIKRVLSAKRIRMMTILPSTILKRKGKDKNFWRRSDAFNP